MPVPVIPAPAASRDGGSRGSRPSTGDLLAYASYVILALFVTGLLWLNPAGRVHATNESDHAFFHWAFAHAAKALSEGTNPLADRVLNAPEGVNLMANTSVLAFAIPLTPVTLWLGPGVSYLIALTLGFAATAAAWYWLLSRHVVASRAAAFLGAALCGFGPGALSQGNGHPNLVAQFLVPFIAWQALRLRHGRPLRRGLILGALVTVQAFINEEVLFLTALGLGVFVLTWAVLRRDEARQYWKPMLTGLAIAAALAFGVLAYPLWYQFFGPYHYRGVPAGIEHYGADIASFPAFGRGSFLGDPVAANRLSANPAEENTFYGWPLLVALLVTGVVLWRSTLVKALTVTGLTLAALSLGPKVMAYGQNTSVPGPWRALHKLPLFDTVVPVRVALFVLPIAGILTALGVQLALTRTTPGTTARRLACTAIAIALVPLTPVPLRVAKRPIPGFIADGTWRAYVHSGESLVTIPVAGSAYADGMRWGAATGLEFRLAGGYFLGPGGGDGRSLFGPPPRPSTKLFAVAYKTGEAPDVSDADREAAAADLAYWRAGAVVMAPLHSNVVDREDKEDALLRTASALYGEPSRIGGLWVWDR
ncbi:hypothetical protein [Longispora albida]|uniref:hypothetical protein n=1 Tax=Longispora albida TaxID=203523 RepID=UPI0003705787|nr:hypothetical protein [Longispora albida]